MGKKVFTMKIVLALVLVACVAIQASPVNKTSVGEGEDGAPAKFKWKFAVKVLPGKKTCHTYKWGKTCEPELKWTCSKCDRHTGKHCKVAKCPKKFKQPWEKDGDESDREGEDGTVSRESGTFGMHVRIITLANKYCTPKEIQHWKMTRKLPKKTKCMIKVISQHVCWKCDKKGKHCKYFKCPEDGAPHASCKQWFPHCTSKDVAEYMKGGHGKVSKDCRVMKACSYSKDWRGPRTGEDDGAPLKGLSVCVKCEKKGGKTHCKEVKCKDGDDEDDGEDDGHPKIKIGKLCVHCKGKRCDIVKCKDGDDEDDGEDDGHPKIKIGKLCVHCKGKRCDIVKCKDGDDEDDGR